MATHLRSREQPFGQSATRWAAAGALAWSLAWPASAIIVDPALGTRPLLTPPSSVIGQWGFNASAVAIGPNHVLTTRHQQGDGLTDNPTLNRVILGGVSYDSISQTLFDPPNQNWDVRVVQIRRTDNGQPANLTNFVPIYTRSAGESLVGQRVVIGGPGVTGVNETASGFDWAPSLGNAGSPHNTFGVRFGENRLDSTNVQTGVLSGFNGAPGWVMDFDAPTATGTLPHEATVGPGDSGGAMLLFRYDQWWLVGLINSVEEPAGTQPDAFYGQDIFGIDITSSSLVSQIETAIGGGFSFPEPKPLPEPSTATLLALAGLLLRRRR